jgi:hypothetical protein
VDVEGGGRGAFEEEYNVEREDEEARGGCVEAMAEEELMSLREPPTDLRFVVRRAGSGVVMELSVEPRTV